MKRFAIITLTLLLITGCAEKDERLVTSSDNINSMKEGLQAYEEQDWEHWQSFYTDDAKIYPNNWDNALTTDQVMGWHKNMISNLSDYGWQEDRQFFNQTIDDEGKTWVNYWGVWEGTIKDSDKTIKIPVHISNLIRNGKVAEEYGYWNMAEYEAEIDKILNTPVEQQKLMQTRDRFLTEFINQKNPAILDEMLADDFVRYMNGEKESEGKQGLIASMGVFNQGFPDLILTNPKTMVKGNTMVVHWTFTGTNTGEFLGHPPTGKKVSVDGMSELKFNSESKIYEEHVFFNQLDMMQQLGYTLTPPAN